MRPVASDYDRYDRYDRHDRREPQVNIDIRIRQ
jgi:hypothetical protein